MNEKQTTPPKGAEFAGSKEAAKGWILILLMIGAVLAAGYFYTH
ncbi:hypothetical protein [Mesorhizobium sp. ANAO-SY3R2]